MKSQASEFDKSRKTEGSEDPSPAQPVQPVHRPGRAVPPTCVLTRRRAPRAAAPRTTRGSLAPALSPGAAGPRAAAGAAVLRPSTYRGVACSAAGGAWGSFSRRLVSYPHHVVAPAPGTGGIRSLPHPWYFPRRGLIAATQAPVFPLRPGMESRE